MCLSVYADGPSRDCPKIPSCLLLFLRRKAKVGSSSRRRMLSASQEQKMKTVNGTDRLFDEVEVEK